MTPDRFREVVKEQFTKCCDTLDIKEKHYSDGTDRLVQFKTAAQLQKSSHIESLTGMMVKHTTKLYQMLSDTNYQGDPRVFPADEWEEILVDQINYLFLLRGLLTESGALEAQQYDNKK